MLDESFRNSTLYKDLPLKGIRCTALQGAFNLNKEWTARFTFYGVDKEVAKSLVMAWLAKEFDAQSFSFHRKANEPSSVFYCKFNRGDL